MVIQVLSSNHRPSSDRTINCLVRYVLDIVLADHWATVRILRCTTELFGIMIWRATCPALYGWWRSMVTLEVALCRDKRSSSQRWLAW